MNIADASLLDGAEKPDWWLTCLLLAVLFTPTFRLPGGIPVRIDDLLVFGTGAILAALAVLKLKIAKLDFIAFYLIILVSTTLLSTLLAPSQIIAVTAKEYFDVLRPVKFLLVYWIIRRHNAASAQSTFLRVTCVSLVAFLGIACLEIFAARVFTGGSLVAFFSIFTERDPEDAQLMLATRPFATFETPVHLGYVAAIGMFLGPQIRSRKFKTFVVGVSFLTLLISVTRTFLFSLPILLLLQAILRGRTFAERIKRMGVATALTALATISAVLILPAISPPAADFTSKMILSVATGDAQSDVSIGTRVQNLELVAYTWQNAPLLGVATRSLLPPFVDSELILTFHRYGVIGFATLLAFYLVGSILAKRTQAYDYEFAHFVFIVLEITFMISITQAALISSRVGVLPFAILGIAAAWQRTAKGQGQTSATTIMAASPLRSH